MPHWMNGWGMGWGWMWLWWIVGLGLVILLVWLLARAMRPGPGGERTEVRREEDTPEQILKKRYARGEIDDEEFHRRMEKLRA